MIVVIGNVGCNRCAMVKKILENKNIEFQYILLCDLKNNENYIKQARNKGLLNFPLIVKNNEVIKLKDIISF